MCLSWGLSVLSRSHVGTMLYWERPWSLPPLLASGQERALLLGLITWPRWFWSLAQCSARPSSLLIHNVTIFSF